MIAKYRGKKRNCFSFFLNIFHVLVPLPRRWVVLTLHVPWGYVDAKAYSWMKFDGYVRGNDVITFITSPYEWNSTTAKIRRQNVYICCCLHFGWKWLFTWFFCIESFNEVIDNYYYWFFLFGRKNEVLEMNMYPCHNGWCGLDWSRNRIISCPSHFTIIVLFCIDCARPEFQFCLSKINWIALQILKNRKFKLKI